MTADVSMLLLLGVPLMALAVGTVVVLHDHHAKTRALVRERPCPAAWSPEVYDVPGVGLVTFWRSPSGDQVLTEAEMAEALRSGQTDPHLEEEA